MTDLIIKNPTEHKIEAQKYLKIAFDNLKVAYDSLQEHKLMTQELADTFTQTATFLLELGKAMNIKKEEDAKD